MAFWDVKYEGNVEPDSDGWTLGGTDLSSASGGILTINTKGSITYTCNYYKSTTFDFSTGATVEFRAKMVSSYGDSPFGVDIGNSSNDCGFRIILKEDMIWDTWGGAKICDFDTTSAFHTYKIKILNTTATLYIDGINKGNIGHKTSGVNSRVTFGDLFTHSSVDIDIDYFYYVGSVDYTIPTVTTQAATNLKNIYCTGNGNITDNGGEVITERGFEYGLSEEAQFCERQVGDSLGIGAYSLTIGGLEPETTYYYRAYATNSEGTAYGDWVSFTTSASPSYGVYEESNSKPDSETGIYANSNKICFYVRKVGGGWGMKHGPYTRDQADIAITQILAAQGKGKYQIKFTSDVLIGLSVSIMTKLDIKAR